MNTFRNKVVVITGAASGIGRALAQQLAAKGARLALSDVDAGGLEETRTSLPQGTEARTYALDVSDRQAVFDHADAVRRDFGTAHFIINNAGVTLIGTVEHCTIEEIEWLLGINLWGVIYGTKAFLPMMLAQDEGCIVNISSVLGMVSFKTQSAYNISKFGIRGLTECLWSELDGTGVRAVSVHPGGIRTSLDTEGRMCAAAGDDEAFFYPSTKKLLTTPPEKCAAKIIAGIERGKRRIVTGNTSRSTWWMSRWLPNSYPAVFKRIFVSEAPDRG